MKILYGVEGYLVDDFAEIYVGDCDYKFEEAEFTVFDFETTGFDPLDTDRIVEIAMIKVINGTIAERYETFINPQRNILIGI